MHDGNTQYFNQIGKRTYLTPKLGSVEAEEVMKFARLVYSEIAGRNSGQIILSGLVRIDIMRLKTENENRLFVNEIEGIDSNFSATNQSHELSTQSFVKDYWAKIIEAKLERFML